MFSPSASSTGLAVAIDSRTVQSRSELMDYVETEGDTIDEAIENALKKLGAKRDEITLEIHAESSGLLIGRKGQTLEALQYLVTRIAGERPGSEGPHILVDIESYRERRRKSLEDMALRLGEKAKRQRKTVTVDALSAADRRIMHAALQDDPWVSTQSLGQGSYRRLLIIPEGDRKKREAVGSPQQNKPGARPQPSGDKAPATVESED